MRENGDDEMQHCRYNFYLSLCYCLCRAVSNIRLWCRVFGR